MLRHFASGRCNSSVLSRSLLVIVLLLDFALPAASFLLDLNITSSSFVYTPFICNATEVSLNPTVCQGGWQMSEDSTNNVEVYTTGSSKVILPQMFLRFRASNIYITAYPDSNATVEAVVAWDSIVRKSNFNSSMGFVDFMGLPSNSTSLLTLTVNPSTSPTLFGLTSVRIETPADVVISSILPSPVTPSSAIPPTTSLTSQTANPNTSTTKNASQSNQTLSRQTIRLAIGLTVGLGVGLPLAIAFLYGLFRWRRKLEMGERRWSFVT